MSEASSIDNKLFITRLDEELHNLDSFDCGEPLLNDFLTGRHAISNKKQRLGTTYIFSNKDNEKEVIGYFTLSSRHIKPSETSKSISRGLPKYAQTIPCQFIARLAVDQKYRGKGYGRRLLLMSMMQAEYISTLTDGVLVLVEAINENAKRFYEKNGFTTLANSPMFLYIKMKQVASIRRSLNIPFTPTR